MTNHHVDAPSIAKRNYGKNTCQGRTHVTNRRISNKSLKIYLTKTQKTRKKRSQQPKTIKVTTRSRNPPRNKPTKSKKPVTPQLKQNTSQNHRARNRSFNMSLRKPKMNTKNGQLNQKDKKHKKPPVAIKTKKTKKRKAPRRQTHKNQINKKRKRNKQSIKNHIKRCLTPFGSVSPTK